MAERKNYNTAAKMGMDINDLEVCEDLNLDPALAFTPGLNKAAMEAVYQRNVADLQQDGMTEEDAMKEASKMRSLADKFNKSL